MAGIFGGDSAGLLDDPASAAIAQGGAPLAPGISPQQLSQLSTLNPQDPAVAAAVAAPGSLWDRLKAGIGTGQLQGALKDAQGAFQNPQPLARPPLQPSVFMIPRHNLYTQSSLNPTTALQQLRGY